MSLLDRFTFEIQFGTFFGLPVWYDLSAYLDLEAGPITVTRGRQLERTSPTPGQLSCQLINDDGRFTPGNTSSPYFPYVLDGAPTRLTFLSAASANLEDNGSHEDGIAEWAGGGTGTAPTLAPESFWTYPGTTLGPLEYPPGEWSLAITWATTSSDSLAQRTIYGLTAGRQYTWTRYVLVPFGSPNVRLQVGGNGLSAAGTYTPVKDQWTKITVTFTATYSSHVLQVQTAFTSTGGVCYTDAGQGEEGLTGILSTYKQPATRLPLWYGHALEFPLAWASGAALAASTQFVAADLLRRLPRRSALRPFDVEEPLLDHPLVLLPLDEPDGATQAGNLGSTQTVGVPVQIGTTAGDTYTFGAGTGPPADGSSSLVLTPTATGNHGWAILTPIALAAATAFSVECWFATTTGGTLVFLSSSQSGSTAYPAGILFTIGGVLRFGTSESFVSDSPGSVTDGATHHAVATYEQTGAAHTIQLFLDGVRVDIDSAITSDVSGKSASWLLAGGAKTYGSFSGTLNHVALYDHVLSADRIAAHYHAGHDGFGGERSDLRVSRLAAYAGQPSLTPAYLTGVWVLDSATYSVLGSTTIVAAVNANLDVGSATVYGQSGGGDDVLAAMNDVADTEGGIVLIDPAGQLQFQARSHRYNGQPSITVDSGDIDPGLSPTYDDALVCNSVVAATEDGAKIRFVNQASIDQRGIYEQTPDLLTRDPLDAYSVASWIVGRQAAPQVRYPTLTFDLATLPDATVNALLALDVGDRIDAAGLPPQAPNAAEGLFVEGLTLTVSPTVLRLTLNTTPADGWAVWQLDSVQYSALESTTVVAY